MQKISVKETCKRLNMDIEIYARYTRMGKVTFKKWVSIFLTPSIQAVFLSRLSHLSFTNGWKLVGRFFSTLNIVLYGADIGMASDIGGGLYLAHPTGIVIYGKLGENVFVSHLVTVGGGMSSARDIGAGPGLPIIDSGVYLGVKSMVQGPVHIGKGSLVAAATFVTKDVPERTIVRGVPGTIHRTLADGELEHLTDLPPKRRGGTSCWQERWKQGSKLRNDNGGGKQ